MQVKSIVFGSFAALLTVPASVSPAFAEDRRPLDELTVTATKRETSLQDTPISITAFGKRGLENTGIDDINKLAKFVPNMVVGQNNHNAQVMIRGIGTTDITIVGDPSVAIHLDDLYIARVSGLNMLMYDTERVEVLRGPQGTLYGRNATGGSVNVISTRPQGELGVDADALVGDYDWTQFRGMLNVPIFDEKLAGRLAVISEKRDGYQENVFPGGTESHDIDARAWRGQLLYTPTDDLSVLFLANDVSMGGVGPQRERLDSPPGNIFNAFQDTLASPRELNSVYKNTPESQNVDSDTQMLRVDWQFVDAMELTFIAGWNDLEFDFILDADQWDDPSLQTVGNSATASDTNTQELRLVSTTDSPVQWLVGLYLLEEETEQPLQVVNVPGVTINNGWAMETENWSLFSHVTWAVTDTVGLIGGLRYSDDTKKGQGRTEVCVTGIPSGPNCLVQNTVVEAENSWDDLTWLLGVDWSPGEHHMFFAKVSTGFKSGGFNLIGTPPAGNETYDPEQITSYEIGWKNSLLDRKLRLNTSAFHYDYDDLQVASIVSFARVTENAAKASINGVELEALYQPTDAWVVNFGLAWLDAKFDSWMGCDPKDAPQVSTIPYDCDPLLNPDDWQDFSGNYLVNSPEWSAFGGIQYTFDFGGVGTLTARAQGHWQDDWFLRPYNVVPEDKQDSYATTDLRLIWRSPEETWYLEGFVNNIGDTVRATSIELTNGGFFGGVTAPQMWGVRLGYSYGGG